MSNKYDKKEAVPVVYTSSDYDTLRAGMKKYQTKEGKAQFAHFLAYMADKGIVRMEPTEGAGYVISSPGEYTKWNNVRARIDFADDAKLQEYLDSMPEEKAAWRKKITEIMKGAPKVKTVL